MEHRSCLLVVLLLAASCTPKQGGIPDVEENELLAGTVLDFNRTFNPLCHYSPAYSCAIPPRENHLRVAIRAGELTYPH